MYRLIILPPAAKYLKKIKTQSLKTLFQEAIDSIQLDPAIGELKTGDLAGILCIDIYYKKINYEIAYTLTELPDKTIMILLVGTRENFYDQLKRYVYN